MAVRIVSPDRHQARLFARRLSLSRIKFGAFCNSIPADFFLDSRFPQHFSMGAVYPLFSQIAAC